MRWLALTPLFFLFILMVAPFTLASPAGEGTGRIEVVGAPVQVSALSIAPLSNPSGNTSSVDPCVWYLWKIELSDGDELKDIGKVAVFLHKDGALKGVWSEKQSQGALWSSIGDAWYEPDLASPSSWKAASEYVDPAQSSRPPLAETTGTWVFAIKLRRLSHYVSGGGWLFEAIVRDKGGNTARRMIRFSVNLYASLTVSSAISWHSSSGSANVSADNHPAIAYTSNARVDVKITATNPTNQYGDSFPASNIYVGRTANPANNDGIKLSSFLQDFQTDLAEDEAVSVESYWFVSVPAGTPTGTYTFTYTVDASFYALAQTLMPSFNLVFSDPFNSFNGTRWAKSSTSQYDPANVIAEAGALKVHVGTNRVGGETYSSSTYLYGSFRARMKVTPNGGVLSAFFLYEYPSENEMDAEFHTDLTSIYFVTYEGGVKTNMVKLALGFDASADYHEYRMDWYYGIVGFYADGVLVFSFFDAPTNALRIIFNSRSPSWLPQPPAESFLYADEVAVYAITP